MEKIEYFLMCLAVVALLILMYLFNRIRKAVLSIFGGSVDKIELGGIIFTGVFIYMVYKEANREHEWKIFNELYIFVAGGAALTGLGLGKVINTYKEIKTQKGNGTSSESESQ